MRLFYRLPNSLPVRQAVRRRCLLEALQVAGHLSLSRPCNSCIGSASSGVLASGVAIHVLRITAHPSPDFLDIWNLLILHLHESAGRTGSTLLDWLLVCRNVESNEQNQVRAEDTHASECCELLTRAHASCWKPWEVSCTKVRV